MNTGWVRQVDAAIRRIIELEVRLELAEEEIRLLRKPEAEVVPGIDTYVAANVTVKRKPGRPRKQ